MKSAAQIKKEEIKRLELKRNFWNWVEATAYAILIIFCIYVIVAYGKPVEPVGQVVEHTVKYYENNLTVIAKKYYPNEYLPDALSSIKKLNNMTESDIYVGQVLRIEVK